MRTIQVKRFYETAKKAGLKRGEFSATSPRNKHGEYEPLFVVIYARLTEEQTRTIAKDFETTVFKMSGKINWACPHISDKKAKLILCDLDDYNKYGLPKNTVLNN